MESTESTYWNRSKRLVVGLQTHSFESNQTFFGQRLQIGRLTADLQKSKEAQKLFCTSRAKQRLKFQIKRRGPALEQKNWTWEFRRWQPSIEPKIAIFNKEVLDQEGVSFKCELRKLTFAHSGHRMSAPSVIKPKKSSIKYEQKQLQLPFPTSETVHCAQI